MWPVTKALKPPSAARGFLFPSLEAWLRWGYPSDAPIHDFPSVRTANQAPAAILIYVLLVFAVMGTLLSLMLTTFGANNRFAERAITDTRLRMENQSTIGKVLGLYRSDPRHPQLGPLGTSRRAVSYLPYIAKRQGYLATNKADVITVDGRDYPDRNLIPTTVTVRNMPGSLGTLAIIARVIRTDTNFIESSTTLRLATPASSATETILNLPADLTNGEQRFVRKWELVLFSDTDILYEAEPNPPTQFVSDRIDIAVTSRNSSVLGANQVVSTNTASYPVRPPSVTLAAPNGLRSGFTGTAVLSSWNYPGISTAYIDTFDALSPNDWTTSGTVTYNNGAATLASGSTLTYANATVNGDFDIRATVTGAASPGAILQATIPASGGTTYKVSVGQVTKFDATGSTCNTSSGSGLWSYLSYTGTAPTDAGDGSTACASSHPNQYLPFAAVTSTYTLRLERRGTALNAFYCEGTTQDCDQADKFTVINPTPFTASGDATLSLGANASTAYQYARVSLIGATPRTYTKTLSFEKTVKIRQVELLGYIPTNANLVTQLTNAISSGCTSHCTAVSYGSQTRIIPSPTLSTSSITLNLSFTSNSGDLSEIPFIYGIRVSYE